MASVAVYLALAVFFLVWPDTFICYGHNTAAIALFVGVVGVVGVNGVALTRKTDASGKAWDVRALNRYGVGFLVMVASIVVVLLIGPIKHLVDQWVFWLEFVLIAQFATFWITQTAERWSEPEPVPPGLYPGKNAHRAGTTHAVVVATANQSSSPTAERGGRGGLGRQDRLEGAGSDAVVIGSTHLRAHS